MNPDRFKKDYPTVDDFIRDNYSMFQPKEYLRSLFELLTGETK